MKNAKVATPEHRCVVCGDKGQLRNGKPCFCAAASADTHPKDGDALAAPLVSGAVPEGQTPKGGDA